MAETKTTTKATAAKAAAPKKSATKSATAVKTAATKAVAVKAPAKNAATKAAPVKATTTAKTAPKATVKAPVKPTGKTAENKVAKPVATGKIRVTMVHGLASCTKRQIRTAKALKLSRPGDTRELPNLPSIIGACKKLEHLVKVEKI